MGYTTFDCPGCDEEVPLSSKGALFVRHLLAVEGEGIRNSHRKGRKFTIPKTKVLCPEQFNGEGSM